MTQMLAHDHNGTLLSVVSMELRGNRCFFMSLMVRSRPSLSRNSYCQLQAEGLCIGLNGCNRCLCDSLRAQEPQKPSLLDTKRGCALPNGLLLEYHPHSSLVFAVNRFYNCLLEMTGIQL